MNSEQIYDKGSTFAWLNVMGDVAAGLKVPCRFERDDVNGWRCVFQLEFGDVDFTQFGGDNHRKPRDTWFAQIRETVVRRIGLARSQYRESVAGRAVKSCMQPTVKQVRGAGDSSRRIVERA